MKNILIAGGSGMVGRHLTQALQAKGYSVKWLSRSAGPNQFTWNLVQRTLDPEAIAWADAIVNLAGAGIADQRWTAARKKELVESRTESALTLKQALARSGKIQIPYLAASAVGIYGNSGENLVDEAAAPADQGFLVQCCQAWEQATHEVAALGNPTTILRIGIVLDTQRGALAEIIKPMKFGLGAWFGSGRMWMPWIHYADLCNMFIWALEHGKTGTFNAVAPAPARNLELTRAARDVFHPRAILAPAPGFGLRLALGELAAVVLNSNRVSAEKVIKAGFEFRYQDLRQALEHLRQSREPGA